MLEVDIAVDQLADRMAELEEEDDEGESGYLKEFNVMEEVLQTYAIFTLLETENRSENV